MKLIELGGIDGTGKDTQQKKISELLDQHPISYANGPNRIKLSTRCPQNSQERFKWYLTGSIDEIILFNLESAKKREEIIETYNREIIIENRGYITIYSSCIARYMQRKKCDFFEAENYVSKLNKDINYVPSEKIHFILGYENKQILIEEVKNRLGNIEDSFMDYLILFDMSIKNISKNFKNCVDINARENPEVISKNIYSYINNL
jgi:thymidylate kinase